MEELKVDISTIFPSLVIFSLNSYNGKQSFIVKKDFKTETVIEFRLPNFHAHYFDLNENLNLKHFKIEIFE